MNAKTFKDFLQEKIQEKVANDVFEEMMNDVAQETSALALCGEKQVSVVDNEHIVVKVEFRGLGEKGIFEGTAEAKVQVPTC